MRTSFNSHYMNRWDSCSRRLSAQLAVEADQRKVNVHIEFMFYAVGWSATDASSLQCSIVNYRSFYTALNEMQADSVALDYDRRHVLEHLVWYKSYKFDDLPAVSLENWVIKES